jgi:hypothetical protein
MRAARRKVSRNSLNVLGCEDNGRRPLSACDVGCRVRRNTRGIDRHVPAAVLKNASRGKPDYAAADHGGAAGGARSQQIGGERRATPRQAKSAAAMPVVVNDGLVAEGLRTQHESVAAKGS